jgi:membrane protein DedA with SNARE-associated domain
MQIELKITIAVIIATCIAGVLWWLWRRYRVRRPPKKDPTQ